VEAFAPDTKLDAQSSGVPVDPSDPSGAKAR
jgi:hypothetical protein